MSDYTLTRARAVSSEVLYAAGIGSDDEPTSPMTRAYQYFHGKWDYVDYPTATQTIALYRRAEGGRIVIYMSHNGQMFSPERSFRINPIVDESLRSSKKLGRLADLRQIGSLLVACGDGGQTYRQRDDRRWSPLALNLFDERVDPEWAFAIRAQGATGAEEEKYWQKHPDEKDERNRRVNMFISQLSLHAIDGPSVEDLYFCGAEGNIFHWNGHAANRLMSPTSNFLLDISVEDEASIWICGRGGTLLHGNAIAGFSRIPCKPEPAFSTIARFKNKIYLSSYSNPRGIFVYDGRISQVRTGLRPELDDVHTVDAVEDALWVIGSKDIARFDGSSWERIGLPR